MTRFATRSPPPDPACQFDAQAATWDAEHGPASVRRCEFEARIDYLREVCRAVSEPRVLDLGCGTGQVLLRLADLIAYGVGVDISPVMIGQAPRHSRLRFAVHDAIRFCTDCTDSFDLVLMVGVFEHLFDKPAVFRGVRHVLAPRGRLVVISPHPWNPAFRLGHMFKRGDEEPPAAHLSPLRLARIAARHGFEISGIRASPYAVWPQLSRSGRRRRNYRPAALHHTVLVALVGLFAGAFAAELTRHA